jgi:VIT1/CCC1 family predicted Fe2+/Mn2+ transporter
VRWRRLFGLDPSPPGHPFSLQRLITSLAAYAITLGMLAAIGAELGLEKPVQTAIGLFAVFAIILFVRYRLERRGS